MSDIEVRGGAGGIVVALDELGAAAVRLRALAGDVVDLAADLGRIGTHPALVAAAALAPGAVLDAELRLAQVVGPSGLVGEASALQLLAEAVERGITLYAAGESAAQRATEHVDRSLGLALGAALPTVVLPSAAAWVLGAAVLRSPPPLSAGAVGGFVGRLVGAARTAPGEAASRVDSLLHDHPWLLERTAAGAEGVVLGLGLGLAPLGIYLAWVSRREGVAYPPTTHAGAVAVLNSAGLGRALDESGFDVETTARPVDTNGWRRPDSLADLVGEQSSVSGQGDVRISGVPLADGRYAWVVDVPGTQTFSPVPGPVPYDQTSNQLLVEGERTLTMIAVTRALTDAKRRVGRGSAGLADPVMTSGHSQGGITAAALAADPVFRAQHPGLTHVTTTGAPVGGVAVPRGVSVLSLEHDRDLVPNLDGRRNPAHGDWVTVRRDVEDEGGRASATHESQRYVETAHIVDDRVSDDPSLRVWRTGAEPFIGGAAARVDPERPVVVVDYEIRRVPRGR